MVTIDLHSPAAAPIVEVPELGRKIAASLRRHRHELARRLKGSLTGWKKYDRAFEQFGGSIDEYLELHFYVFIDYLERYCRSGDVVYKHLYLGEKLKQFQDLTLTPEENRANRERVTESDIEIFCGTIGQELGTAAAGQLEAFLRDVQSLLLAQGRKTLKMLWIGDCLYLDIQGFLAAMALEDGITFEVTIVASKNPVQQREELRRLASQKFDLIFYSPFTYEFSPAIGAFHGQSRRATMGRQEIARIAAEEMAHVEAMMELLGTLYDVPCYIHNTVNIKRHDAKLKDLVKLWLTRRPRRISRDVINARIAERIAAWRGLDASLILLDELPLLEQASELTLGRQIYATFIQHPAELGRRMASRYREILAVHADLVGKKVLVCDLDNTLWKGEIGEGAVEHYRDLQRTLKELRRKGVLLAVNSKNDPRKVHWDGAVLGADDFVAMEINWDSKVANMRRLQQALNLKLKDFVFIDDRADQRELVHEAMPEVCVLDALSPRIPEQMALWAAALPDNPEMDRTQQYRQREERESFLTTGEAVADDSAQAFARLEIQVEIREAVPGELKRVAELINRTNQFNMAGSRISLKELKDWLTVSGRRVVVAEARDKFGPMGVVSALLLDLSGPELVIPAFVLSCRVFGYGIEDAILGAVKRLARAGNGNGPLPIRGAFQETAHNEPCRAVYPNHGFRFDGQSWILAEVDTPGHPAWLTVNDRL